jgi:integrase
MFHTAQAELDLQDDRGAISLARAQEDRAGGLGRLIYPEEGTHMRMGKKTSENREVFEQNGERGSGRRLALETRRSGDGLIQRWVVRWGPKGARRQRSWPCTDAGATAAEDFFHGRATRVGATSLAVPANRGATGLGETRPLSTNDLWQDFDTARAPELSPKTIKLYGDAFREWQQEIGSHTPAGAFDVKTIGAFRATLEKRPLATATIRMIIRNIKIVYRWGTTFHGLPETPWPKYEFRVAKGKKTKQRAEYREHEFVRIWRARDPKRSDEWRSWVAIGLLGIYGSRGSELVGLQWDWIKGDRIIIPGECVKTGEELEFELFALTRGILEVAKAWRLKLGYRGPYVLFPGQAKGRTHQSKSAHYTIGSLISVLHTAERRVNVPTVKFRATHGFRRGLVGDLIDETGDCTLAIQAIGDIDMNMLKNYRVRRKDKVAAAVQNRANRLFPEP